jgi:hypothetical protein
MPELMVFNRQRTYGGSPEVIATTNAFYAVGVGSAYGVLEYCASKVVLLTNISVKFN